MISEKYRRVFLEKKIISMVILIDFFISIPLSLISLSSEHYWRSYTWLIGKKKFLSKNYIKEIFEKIINDSVIIQKKIQNNINIYKYFKIPKFSILGPKGSYSYIAALKYAKKK